MQQRENFDKKSNETIAPSPTRVIKNWTRKSKDNEHPTLEMVPSDSPTKIRVDAGFRGSSIDLHTGSKVSLTLGGVIEESPKMADMMKEEVSGTCVTNETGGSVSRVNRFESTESSTGLSSVSSVAVSVAANVRNSESFGTESNDNGNDSVNGINGNFNQGGGRRRARASVTFTTRDRVLPDLPEDGDNENDSGDGNDVEEEKYTISVDNYRFSLPIDCAQELGFNQMLNQQKNQQPRKRPSIVVVSLYLSV